MISKSQTKYIQSLHHKKFRDEEYAFIAEGEKVVAELLQANVFACKQLAALPEWLLENKKIIAKYTPNEVFEINEHELEKISALTTPNKVLAVFAKAKEASITVAGNITLALDEIKDPGNLGTIIRIADWFGISSVVCSRNSADVYNPKVVQSTMGSLARVNVLYVDLHKWLDQQKKVKRYAATLNGTSIKDLKSIKEAIIIIGNESKGISDDVLQLANEKITIPAVGKAESLNAAVATGIILSHIV